MTQPFCQVMTLVVLKRQSRQKVCCLCSNNGSEFINQTMTKFCHHNSIVYETTIPYIPEQNGIAKRTIAVFFEMVQSMLYTAGISLCYQDKAFTYAIHIQTLCFITVLNGIVLYEAQTSHKPDISHLYILGLLRWAHISKQVCKGKLESQAIKVKMLGQQINKSKSYCLKNLENNKLITS